MMIDLPAEQAHVEALRVAWLNERAILHATLEECRRSHATPGPNYWEAEHRARGRFMMAANVMAILEGV